MYDIYMKKMPTVFSGILTLTFSTRDGEFFSYENESIKYSDTYS